MEVSYQGYTIHSALHNLHGGVISSLYRLILSSLPSRRCQIKRTPSAPHSSAFVEVSDHHPFLTPPRVRCQIKSTPSIHHSTTFVEVSHHVYTIQFSLHSLSWRCMPNLHHPILTTESSWCHIKSTPSFPHSEHRFPAPSSKLCQIWLRHWRGTLYLPAAVYRRGQRPPKSLGTNMTVEAQICT